MGVYFVLFMNISVTIFYCNDILLVFIEFQNIADDYFNMQPNLKKIETEWLHLLFLIIFQKDFSF
jgi:hypothetical protein